MLSENDAEKKASQMNVKISDLNNDLIVEMKVNNKMMKEKCVVIKTNKKMIKKD